MNVKEIEDHKFDDLKLKLEKDEYCIYSSDYGEKSIDSSLWVGKKIIFCTATVSGSTGMYFIKILENSVNLWKCEINFELDWFMLLCMWNDYLIDELNMMNYETEIYLEFNCCCPINCSGKVKYN